MLSWSKQLTASNTTPLSTLPTPLTVVVTSAFRTPLCKFKKGQFKDTSSDELLLSLFEATRENINIDPALIGDM